jgi:hypothetical protein
VPERLRHGVQALWTRRVAAWSSSWRDKTDDDSLLCQHLHRDGACLGLVVRYHADGPTYAWWRRSGADVIRIGACSSDQAARAAVERALGEVGS